MNLIAARLPQLGKQPLQLALGGRYYFGAPDGGPEWGIRFTIILPFPE